MTRAEQMALKAYPKENGKVWSSAFGTFEFDKNAQARKAYQEGYEQAEKDMIERACQLLYDYNKQMAEMFGAKAVLSCNQFTIDVKRFRKTLIMEKE